MVAAMMITPPLKLNYFAILIVLVSAGCSTIFTVKPTPTASPTPTPERLKLVNGEIDTCLLVSTTEVEITLGIKVIRKNSETSCIYRSVSNDRAIFITDVITDATLKKAGLSITAVESYEMEKISTLEHSKMWKFEEIENLGDQAYLTDSSDFVTIHVLKNKISYEFIARTIDVGGIGYETLMKLTKIALQRMP